ASPVRRCCGAVSISLPQCWLMLSGERSLTGPIKPQHFSCSSFALSLSLSLSLSLFLSLSLAPSFFHCHVLFHVSPYLLLSLLPLPTHPLFPSLYLSLSLPLFLNF